MANEHTAWSPDVWEAHLHTVVPKSLVETPMMYVACKGCAEIIRQESERMEACCSTWTTYDVDPELAAIIEAAFLFGWWDGVADLSHPLLVCWLANSRWYIKLRALWTDDVRVRFGQTTSTIGAIETHRSP